MVDLLFEPLIIKQNAFITIVLGELNAAFLTILLRFLNVVALVALDLTHFESI